MNGMENKNVPPGNPTKKAIVLQTVSGTPTPPTPEERTNWIQTAISVLNLFGATETQKEVITQTYATNFPEYYVWVLPDNMKNVGTIPAFQGGSTVFNVEQFTKCVVDNASIDGNLLQGACVRIDYENRKTSQGAYVVNIINNEQDFANAVILELDGIPSPGGSFAPCNESGVSVRHPTGDPLGTNTGGGTPHFEPVIPVGEPSQWPTRGTMTSHFQTSRPPVAGATTKSAAHPGIDIGAPLGTDVYPAIGHGKVVSMNKRSADGNPCQNGAGYCNASGDGRGFGNWVRIKHTIDGKTLYTQYNHLQEVLVSVGATVSMTSKIAKTGHTGLGTGPHLHWELWAPSWTSRRYKPSAPGSTHVDPIQGLRLQLPANKSVAPNAV
jgi:murein DD-endopeptidase MepM/ murein hydrolase activator NlpD